MLSGDKFVCDKHNPNAYIQEHFDDLNILTTDMESTSLANACHLLDIPFVVVRVVSDILESVGQKESYEEVLKVSSLVAKEVINKLI
jgi:adenosylhomocysteine nucleosidase